MALAAGFIAGTALALVLVATRSIGPHPVAAGIAVAILMLPPCAGLVWALIVDRDTLRGATKNPEQSIESAWYDRAASGALGDTVVVTGLGAAVIVFTGVQVPTELALAAVILVAIGSVAIRYLIQQRRG